MEGGGERPVLCPEIPELSGRTWPSKDVEAIS